MFYGGINPYELTDDQWSSAYNSIQYLLNKRAEKIE